MGLDPALSEFWITTFIEYQQMGGGGLLFFNYPHGVTYLWRPTHSLTHVPYPLLAQIAALALLLPLESSRLAAHDYNRVLSSLLQQDPRGGQCGGVPAVRRCGPSSASLSFDRGAVLLSLAQRLTQTDCISSAAYLLELPSSWILLEAQAPDAALLPADPGFRLVAAATDQLRNQPQYHQHQ